MKDLKARLKTVQELLNNAEFIRKRADSAASGEANDWELLLKARKEELEEKIEGAKTAKKPETALAHAE